MTHSNWKGSSGWGSVKDPTGVLGNIVLQASAGNRQLCQDYLIQEIGTSNAFNKAHYEIKCDFASSSDNVFNGSIALCARVSDYTTSTKTPLVPQKLYRGIVDFFRQEVYISRIFNNEEKLIATTKLPLKMGPNVKYSFSFICYGNGTVGGTHLAIKINNKNILQCMDNEGRQILSGTPGLQIQSGVIYVDNFAVFELDQDGNPA